MKVDKNKNLAIAVVSALTVASVAAITGIISRNLKRNLIRDLNDSEFENFGEGRCSHNCYGNDSFDDVLRYRKNRCYQRSKMY